MQRTAALILKAFVVTTLETLLCATKTHVVMYHHPEHAIAIVIVKSLVRTFSFRCGLFSTILMYKHFENYVS